MIQDLTGFAGGDFFPVFLAGVFFAGAFAPAALRAATNKA